MVVIMFICGWKVICQKCQKLILIYAERMMGKFTIVHTVSEKVGNDQSLSLCLEGESLDKQKIENCETYS